MRYLPHTKSDIQSMCEQIGIASPQELFQVIPDSYQLKEPLNIPKALSENELLQHLRGLSEQNETVDTMDFFLGAGAYYHHIPAAVSALASRGEFLTAYTPYQAEISQGTLQSIFEFQTMIAHLAGMEVANASNYDGASALAEAILMAMRLKKKYKVLVSASIHPQYLQVLNTYLTNLDIEIVSVPSSKNGRLDLKVLKELIDDEVAALAVQSPNCFGVVEDIKQISDLVHQEDLLLVGCFSEALSLCIFQSWGEVGADIVCGEGQSFGNALNFGGPYLGLFATKKKFVRQMPGRLVSETVDQEGRRGFVLALSTREQHIRREKATSNICTNQGLCALMGTIYLSLMGPKGLQQVALQNYSNARYLRERLLEIPMVKRKYSAPHFNEFVIEVPEKAENVLASLRDHNILGGLDLSIWHQGLSNCILVCATEMNSKAQIDRYVQILRKVL